MRNNFTSSEGQTVKVFLSWSGNRSKKVALILRDWLPSVIQSIEPFVSSEDIEKGSRWNTDIAQELKASTFGIICVTKDNLAAPWLNFEAGALSKTIDNIFVAPFLFDVKPSELTGSPISQFQATSSTKEDLRRLIETLNTAAGNCLPPPRLEQAFNLWYTSLEDELNKLRSEPIVTEENDKKADTNPDIFEELLEISRNTQRLVGNTDVKLYNYIEQLQKKIDDINYKNNQQLESARRYNRRISPMFIEDFLFSSKSEEFLVAFPYNLLILLSFYREDIPWLYDAGNELVRVLQTNESRRTKQDMAEKFIKLLDITCGHPMIRDLLSGPRKDGFVKESIIALREMRPMIMDVIYRSIDNAENNVERL